MAWVLKAKEIELAAMKQGKNMNDVRLAAGIAVNTLYDAMKGRRRPTLKTVSKIAAALGVSVEEIAEREEDRSRQ